MSASTYLAVAAVSVVLAITHAATYRRGRQVERRLHHNCAVAIRTAYRKGQSDERLAAQRASGLTALRDSLQSPATREGR